MTERLKQVIQSIAEASGGAGGGGAAGAAAAAAAAAEPTSQVGLAFCVLPPVYMPIQSRGVYRYRGYCRNLAPLLALQILRADRGGGGGCFCFVCVFVEEVRS